jgi:hypothetical protein
VEQVLMSQMHWPAPVSQREPVAQLAQAAPAVPQEPWLCAWQWLPEQHPEGQEAALH